MVNFIHVARTLCIVASVAALAGCGTIKAYDGPELPLSEISVLDSRHGHSWVVAFAGVLPIPMRLRHSTIVLAVDGHVNPTVFPYHLRPGQHTAKVRYDRNSLVNLCGQFGCIIPPEVKVDLTINFTTEAGHEYRIPAQRWGERN